MSKVAKTTVVIMGLTIFSKFLGLIREQVLASAYGTGMYAEAYITAMKIPTILFAAIGGALATSLIPVYSKINENEGKEEAQKFISNLINIVSLVTLLIVILGLIFTEPLVKLFAIGFEGEKLSITINFVRIILWAIIFIGINNIITGYLQLNNKFTIPALIGIPYNFIVISSIFLSTNTSPYVLIIGSLLALISQVLFQLPSVKKTGLKHKYRINLKDENVKNMIILVLPVLVGVGVEQINTLIDGTLATTFGEGVVAAFNYANRLYGFVSAIFVSSLLSVVYPIMAKSSASNDKVAFKDSIRKTMNIIIIFMVPICVGTMVLSKPIVKVLFQRGEFNATDTAITANILMVYIVSIIAFSLRNVMSRAFYSLHDTKTPMINGTISIIFNIVLNIILSKYMGYIGLSVATTIASFIGLVLFIISIQNKIGDFGINKTILTTIKSIIAASVMGITTSICFGKLSIILGSGLVNEVITLGVSIFVGVCIYGVLIILLKIDETKIVINLLNNKLKIKK